MTERGQYFPNQNHKSTEQKELLFAYLNENFALDFKEYSESSVLRRISKILDELQFSDVKQYIEYLQSQPNPRELFLEKFTVNVTEMFRDPHFYSCFTRMIVDLAQEKEHIKIWSAGCSSGEETVSLAILLEENNILDKTTIIGSDLSSAIIKKAQRRTYKQRHLDAYEASYKEASGKYSLDKYYTKEGDNVIINEHLYRTISFLENDLMTSAPAADFDIIICRNVLIYFNAQLQNSVLAKFNQSLNHGGYLILGSKESIIFFQERDLFTEIEPESRIYKKVR